MLFSQDAISTLRNHCPLPLLTPPAAASISSIIHHLPCNNRARMEKAAIHGRSYTPLAWLPQVRTNSPASLGLSSFPPRYTVALMDPLWLSLYRASACLEEVSLAEARQYRASICTQAYWLRLVYLSFEGPSAGEWPCDLS